MQREKNSKLPIILLVKILNKFPIHVHVTRFLFNVPTIPFDEKNIDSTYVYACTAKYVLYWEFM